MKSSFNKNRYNSKNDTLDKNPAAKYAGATDVISNNQVISGYFINEKPYKEILAQRLNIFLSFILASLVLFCFVCYYFVSCKEVQLKQISRETLELNYENDELQNKVDSLQSYYNIDKAVSRTNILERAQQVVEIDAVDLPNVDFKSKEKQPVVVSY